MKAKLLETFINPVLLYGPSTIVLRVVDNNPIKAVLNTASSAQQQCSTLPEE